MNNRCFPAAGEAPGPLPCVGLATVTLSRGPGPGGLSPPSLAQRQGEAGEQGPAALLAARPLRGRNPDGDSSPQAPAPPPPCSPFLPLFLALPVHSVSSRARALRPA